MVTLAASGKLLKIVVLDGHVVLNLAPMKKLSWKLARRLSAASRTGKPRRTARKMTAL